MIEHQWELQGLLRRHLGIVTADEMEESDAWLHADPRFSGVDYLIEDLRGCAGLVGVNAAGLRRSSSAHAAFLQWPGSFRHAWVTRWATPALIAPPEAVTEAAPLRLRTFRFIADARDWIDDELVPCIDMFDGL
jgi:hypothetical protein